MTLRYLSVCSGIEAASVAWQPLGWQPVAFAEIDPFASAVLAHRFPTVRNLGDFRDIECGDVGTIDVLVGGTPCQSFSVAGLRRGLDDDRGNLALEFCRLADRVRPRWIVWENVPGVLSSNHGRDFGAILGALVELGYGWAYRVLDAQYFGLAQRRRRVFVVANSGDWRLAAAVLFERHCLSWNPPPRRPARQDIVHSITSRAGNGSRPAGGTGNVIAFGGNNTSGPIEVAAAVRAKGGSGHMDFESETFVVGTMSSAGGTERKHGHGWGQQDWENGYCIPVPWAPDVADPVTASEGGTYAHEGRNNFRLHNVVPAVAVSLRGRDGGTTAELSGDVMPALRTGGGGGDKPHTLAGMRVRRLTPRECERLQGLPDDWTLVPYRGRPAKDGPRYRAIGNSFPVPVVRWIGERISLVERLAG